MLDPRMGTHDSHVTLKGVGVSDICCFVELTQRQRHKKLHCQMLCMLLAAVVLREIFVIHMEHKQISCDICMLPEVH